MSITRRKFIQVGAVTLLAASVPAVGADLVFGQGRRSGQPSVIGPGDIPFANQQDAVFFFSAGTFGAYVDSSFQITGSAGQQTTLRLIAVDEPRQRVKPTRGGTRGERFSLFFTGDKEPVPEGSYAFTHDALGTFNLFIVPIVSRNEQIYQAVINHSVAPD